jgi:CRISPR/Cas system-associated endonuclease Cas1
MQRNGTRSAPAVQRCAPTKDGMLVLTGYGVIVSVERGHLVVRDGVADERREGRLHRALGRLKRLVILGHTGTITLEAIRWLHDVGAAIVQIDRDGTVVGGQKAGCLLGRPRV